MLHPDSPVSVRMENDLIRVIDRCAQAEGISRAAFIRNAATAAAREAMRKMKKSD